MKKYILAAALSFAAFLSARAEDVSLMPPGQDLLGWSFDRGQEFPGAQGKLSLGPTQQSWGEESLKLEGDFSGGGAYVRAYQALKGINVNALDMWLKSPDADHVTLRILDATGQCHQITFKIRQQDDWQKFDFHLQEFFTHAELPGGTAISHYESWGGAGDQKWHGPAQALDILISPTDQTKKVTLWFGGMTLHIGKSTEASSPQMSDNIARLSFETARLGNLFYPQDRRLFRATLETTRPLGPGPLALQFVVRDYGGAEQAPPQTAFLRALSGEIHGHSAYQATIDLGDVPLEVGRYYELHATVGQLGGKPYREHTSFALLPEAAANSFAPSKIPFSSRDWDNRLTEYFLLSHRLGVRICGIWSGWDADRPEQSFAPGIDLCAKLGMGVIASTPIHLIEEHSPGYKNYTEPVLRSGVRHLIEKYGKITRPFILSLGNEPHGTGDRVLEDVKAYACVYDEAKKTDPSIQVLGTSVGPEEEFFRDGFGKYCDAYDFHVYDEAPHVAAAFQKYRALFATYANAKPIWATELGLDSQGVSRRFVAADMIRKVALFFANGGVNMSWFDLLYPDPDGTASDGSGAAHNVFDSRYDRYAPKLTAVLYYDLINTILDKKFVAEKDFGDVHLYLFRNAEGRSLIIGWKDRGRQDLFLPLPGVQAIQLVHTDSSRQTLDAADGGVTLSLEEDPVLISFAGTAGLPETVEKPTASFSAIPESLEAGSPSRLTVLLNGLSAEKVSLITPALWRVEKSVPAPANSQTVQFTVTCPAESAVHEAGFVAVIRDVKGQVTGAISLRLPVTSSNNGTTP